MLDFIAKYVPDAQDWGFAELGEILGRHILQEWQFRLKPGDFVVSFERDTWEDDIWVAYFQIVKRDKKEIEVPLTDAQLKAARDLGFPQRPEQFIAGVIAHASNPEQRRATKRTA